MNASFVFFSPQGRLSPRQFGRGLIILVAAIMIILIASAFVSPGIGILQWLLVFPYFCLFAKRLHDAGQSAWLYLLFLLGYFVLTGLLTALLLNVLSPDAAIIQAEFQEIALGGDFSGAMEAMSERGLEVARKSILTTVTVVLLTNGILGLVAGKMKSDPVANRYGPPAGQFRIRND